MCTPTTFCRNVYLYLTKTKMRRRKKEKKKGELSATIDGWVMMTFPASEYRPVDNEECHTKSKGALAAKNSQEAHWQEAQPLFSRPVAGRPFVQLLCCACSFFVYGKFNNNKNSKERHDVSWRKRVFYSICDVTKQKPKKKQSHTILKPWSSEGGSWATYGRVFSSRRGHSE